MTDQKDSINLDDIVFDDNNQEIESWSCLGQTCSIYLIVFLSHLFVILLIIFVAFGEFIFQKFGMNQLFGWWEFCVVQLGTFYHHQDYEQVNLYKESRLRLVGHSVRGRHVIVYLQLAQN